MRKSLWASASTNEFSNILHRHSKQMNEKKLNIGFSRWYFDEKKNEFFTYLNACKYVNSVLICHKCIRTPTPALSLFRFAYRSHSFFCEFFQYNWNCTNKLYWIINWCEWHHELRFKTIMIGRFLPASRIFCLKYVWFNSFRKTQIWQLSKKVDDHYFGKRALSHSHFKLSEKENTLSVYSNWFHQSS